MTISLVENGYAIRGIAPRDLRERDEPTKLLYWSWVTELGLRAKDKELSQGLDKDGRPLRAISAATRKHRRSAMTPSGKGDPSAPPLMPARALSRTRSLLSGRAYPDHAEFWWRFDAFSGGSWARTLEKQRDRWGRDVFGISPKAQKLIQARSYELWDRWKRGLPVQAVRGAIIPMAPAVQAPPPERAGLEDWRRLFAQPAKAAQPGRPGAPGNVLLRHIFGAGEPPMAKPVTVTPPKPKPPTVARVAMTALPTHPIPAIASAIRTAADAGVKVQVLSGRAAEAHWGKLRERTAAAYNPGDKVIYVNATFKGWEDPAVHLAAPRRRGWFSSADANHWIHHEIGHYHHHRAIGTAALRRASKAVVPPDLRDAIRREVSAYAATVDAEFVAEVYAGMKAGKRYSRLILDRYRDLGGIL